MLTVEQRRSMYDKKIKRLMEIGHIDEEEMKTLIKQLRKVIHDTDDDVENDSNLRNDTINNIYQYHRNRSSE